MDRIGKEHEMENSGKVSVYLSDSVYDSFLKLKIDFGPIYIYEKIKSY